MKYLSKEIKQTPYKKSGLLPFIREFYEII
jgi:hypothetical protein